MNPKSLYREALVSHFERFPRSTSGNTAVSHQLIEWPNKNPHHEPRLYCAYNQTREQFLCAHVELLDLPPEAVGEPLSSLTPGSTKALWLAPFQGIDQSQVNVPIDLVFLDSNNCVLAMAESFPVAQPTTCNWPVGTALALPAQSIASSGTLVGDHLILCSPEKMKRRFLNLRGFGDGHQEKEETSFIPQIPAIDLPPIHGTPVKQVKLSNWEEVLQQPMPAKHLPVFASTPVPQQVSMRVAEGSQPAVDPAAPKNWLLCLLTPQPRDKRNTLREFLPWVAAYFFNGATPAPASVRDISMSGMYVLTTERWYLGTIIHVTLTDWRLPSPERSVTVNAMAVRWGKDGVGLHFVFPRQHLGKPTAANASLVDVTPSQVKEFLQRFKSGPRPSAAKQ